ncbi:type VII secretion-associated serine protease mycosin [Umezawaea sp. Da 62-37]|uniref:type VII secretion-associated serine protease mycosin n=1 Tax=Umezawaea sp. Da 62-37 TaxID=3075927 RepID=UPI0028F6C6A2|nr:type VII secretion-associated serine protease mycosin [Umezawaea sp. Da 62-37]WNV88186.1 type VII secretion-associated serine protease mycosin [Umezawaea sp. Da 62-37]
MRLSRKATGFVAATLLLAVGQPASTLAGTPPPNSVPPPVDRSLRPGVAAPSADQTYKRNSKACNESGTDGAVLTTKPHSQLVLRLDEAHRFATGKGVTIAVIDTGVEPHERLKGRVEAGGDYVVPAEQGLVDCDGHGTEVAGVAAASKDDASGFVGAAPDAKILSIRQKSDFYEAEGTRKTTGDVATLAQAVVRAVDRGADVINISLTLCAKPAKPSQGERQLQAAIDWAVNEKDVVIVTAAGNLGAEGKACPAQNDKQDEENVNVVASPPWYRDDVLSVASVDRGGNPSQFSLWGPWVGIAAPGEEITTIDPHGDGLTNAAIAEDGTPTGIQGTSFAAPYVAGIAALVRERHPELTARQVVDRLTSTAQHPGDTDGRDRKVGAGMVNPVAALTAVLPAEQPGYQAPAPPPVMTELLPAPRQDRTPVVVALSGTGIALGLLLFTMFVLHTTKRTRERRG